MRAAIPTLLALAVSLAACGGAPPTATTEYPLPDDVSPSEGAAAAPLADDQAVDLTACKVASRGANTLDLRCEQAAISELRAERAAEPEAMLDDIVASLQGRYGDDLAISREAATVDGIEARVRTFRGVGEPPVSGLVVSLPNSQELFWAVACFREEADVDLAWCRRAIAHIARHGGAGQVDAQPMDPLTFADREITIAPGCRQTAPFRVACPGGELSWMSPDGRAASEVRDETVAKLRSAAEAEKVEVAESAPACRVSGQVGDCKLLRLSGADDASALSFLVALAKVDGADVLAICSMPGAGDSLPPPCDQVLALEN